MNYILSRGNSVSSPTFSSTDETPEKATQGVDVGLQVHTLCKHTVKPSPEHTRRHTWILKHHISFKNLFKGVLVGARILIFEMLLSDLSDCKIM